MITAARHTGFVVADMERALEFYEDILGLRVVQDGEREGEILDKLFERSGVRMRAVMLRVPGGHCIELFQFYSHPKKAPRDAQREEIDPAHVALQVDDLDEMYERMRARGVRFRCPPQVDPGGYAKFTYCEDFDGTVVELTEVLDETRTPYAD